MEWHTTRPNNGTKSGAKEMTNGWIPPFVVYMLSCNLQCLFRENDVFLSPATILRYLEMQNVAIALVFVSLRYVHRHFIVRDFLRGYYIP